MTGELEEVVARSELRISQRRSLKEKSAVAEEYAQVCACACAHACARGREDNVPRKRRDGAER